METIQGRKEIQYELYQSEPWKVGDEAYKPGWWAERVLTPEELEVAKRNSPFAYLREL